MKTKIVGIFVALLYFNSSLFGQGGTFGNTRTPLNYLGFSIGAPAPSTSVKISELQMRTSIFTAEAHLQTLIF